MGARLGDVNNAGRKAHMGRLAHIGQLEQRDDTEKNNATIPASWLNETQGITERYSGLGVIMTRQLEEITSRELEEGIAKGTRKVLNTQLAAWGRFCQGNMVSIDEDAFGAITERCGDVTLSQIVREVDTLAMFAAWYVTQVERKRPKYTTQFHTQSKSLHPCDHTTLR